MLMELVRTDPRLRTCKSLRKKPIRRIMRGKRKMKKIRLRLSKKGRREREEEESWAGLSDEEMGDAVKEEEGLGA
jgi:hypothetical protein